MANTLYVTGARLSFPKIIEAVAYQASEPRFSCDLILPQNDPMIAQIMSEIGAVASEKWKEHAGAVLQNCQNNRKLRCWGAGTEKVNQKTFQVYDGYNDGMFYLSAASQADRPPQLIRPDTGQPIDNANSMERTAAARKLYGGCYVNAAIRFWCQDNNFGKGVRCQLMAVQFSKDGQPFGEEEPDFNGKFQPQQIPQGQQQVPQGFPGAPQVPQGIPPGNGAGIKMPWEF